ncbi:YchJ family protein [Streptomyces sp. NPDC050418]|uniref:YchJ family protein n=1 Tax=Streptomyces sp. NPDC050418 TaxID=3365612 RepID=UPI0037BA401E
MSRRPKRRAQAAPAQRTPAAAATSGSPCPCGRGNPYGACCERLHTGAVRAATPEDLMRSRYAAFVVRDEAYLLRTWHPDTRPPAVEFDPGTRWAGLSVEGTSEGTAFHSAGTVTFRARYSDDGVPGELHERSRFVRIDGAWVYVDGDFLGAGEG